MKIVDAEAMTTGYEDEVLKVYPDSLGNPTAGIGHLMQPGTKIGTPITEHQSRAWFSEDFDAAYAGALTFLDERAGKDAGDELQRQWEADDLDSRHAALIDVAFVLGASKLRKFEKLGRAWKAKDWTAAGDNLLFVDPFAHTQVFTPYRRQVKERAVDNAYRIRTNTEPRPVDPGGGGGDRWRKP